MSSIFLRNSIFMLIIKKPCNVCFPVLISTVHQTLLACAVSAAVPSVSSRIQTVALYACFS